jgi:hypothetical protein
MAVNVLQTGEGKVLEVHASGKLSEDDYRQFVPEVERLISEHGKISIVFEMSQFHGWEPGALWADIKFDFKHFKDIDRLAMIGDMKWQEWMAKFCRPFTTAAIRYFDHADSEKARLWAAGQ